MKKEEKEVLQEIRDYLNGNGVVESCCMENSHLNKIVEWWKKLSSEELQFKGNKLKEI